MRAQLKSMIVPLALGLPLALLGGCAGSGPTWVAQGPVTIIQVAAPTHVNTQTHTQTYTRTDNYNGPATINNNSANNNSAPLRAGGPMNVTPQSQPLAHQGQGGSVLYAYSNPYGPEYDRRDGDLGVHTSSATDDWYAWPDPQHPTLDRSRSFNTGRNPQRYVYPARDDRSSGSYRRHRSGASHGHYHRVR